MKKHLEQATVLITGGAGFVGSHLALRLRKTFPKARIMALDNLKRRGSELNLPRLREAGIDFVHGDVRQNADLLALPHVDVLLECSAEPSVLAGYQGGAQYVVDTNLLGTVNCLELAARDGADVLFLSTSRVYPFEPINAACTEGSERFEIGSDISETGLSRNGLSEDFTLKGVRTLYGATKLASELLVTEYAAMHGLRYVIDRCGVIAGPWQMGKTDQGFVLLWLARHQWKLPLGYIGFGGKGRQVRDVLHVDDLCDLVLLQLDQMDRLSGSTFNVGGGPERSASLNEFTALCAKVTGNKVEMGSDPATRPGDVKWYVTDNARVTAATGWAPRRDLERILSDSLAWLKQHDATLRVILG